MRPSRLELSAAVAFLLVLLSAGGLGVTAAMASFPGRNGLIAFVTNAGCYHEVHTARSNGSDIRELTTDSCERNSTNVGPAWSPRGRNLLYARLQIDSDDAASVVMAPDGSHKRVVNTTQFETVSWSPDGHELAWELEDEIWLGTLRNPRQRFIAKGYDAAWSPDGRSVAVAAYLCSEIALYDPKTAVKQRTLVRPPAKPDGECNERSYSFDWSPSGRRLVYTVGNELTVIGADGRNEHVIRRAPGSQETGPVWSPDGRLIAYVRNVRGRDPDVYAVRPNGKGNHRLFRGGFSLAWQARKPFD